MKWKFTDRQTLSTTRNSWDLLAHSSLCKILKDLGIKGFKGLKDLWDLKGFEGIYWDLKGFKGI